MGKGRWGGVNELQRNLETEKLEEVEVNGW